MKLSEILNILAVSIVLAFVISIVGAALGFPKPLIIAMGFLGGLQVPRIIKAFSSKSE